MDANEEQNLLAKKTQAYQNMASCEKEKLFEKQTNLRSTAQHTKLLKCNVLDSCINSFQNKIKEGPYYICSVCNRILYRKTVIQLKKNKMAQLTYENRNLKERITVLTTMSDERLLEYEECKRELETKGEMPFCNRV